MEPGERPGEALGAVVAVFQGHVHHPAALAGQLDPGLGKPPQADVLAQGDPAHQAEHPLEVEAGGVRLTGDLGKVQLPVQVLLHVVDGVL